MNRAMRFAAIAALGLAVAACGKGAGAGTDNANLSDADNMLVPADEGAPIANEDGGNASDTDAAAVGGNVAVDNMGAGNAR